MGLLHSVVRTDRPSAQELQFDAVHVLANKVKFRHDADKHRPQTAAHIAAYEVVDRSSENQIVALARRYFLEHAPMVKTQNPA